MGCSGRVANVGGTRGLVNVRRTVVIVVAGIWRIRVGNGRGWFGVGGRIV
jgi:hypothetical protein